MTDFSTILARDITARRISVELVREAYSVSGLKPQAFCTVSHDFQCGCPVGAIHLCSKPTQDDATEISNEATIWAAETFGKSYTRGFMTGFDTHSAGWNPYDGGREGFIDGRAAREAVLGKGEAGTQGATK
jgi:hypothetical protein